MNTTLRIPKAIRDIEDPFSKELIDLWDSRKLKGLVFSEYDEEGIVSYILLEDRGEVATIRGFFTVPRSRGKGYGTQLLQTVCDLCDSFGKKTIVVNITKGAQNPYIRTGFVPLGKRKDFPNQVLAYRGELSESLEKELKRKIK